ncbi:MAG: hypothetical protein EPN22_15670 [Nitrospirae bacterium]|nr:MAG: hypothetical protein EPN22_15670 [Nitrospirota bacterium]
MKNTTSGLLTVFIIFWFSTTSLAADINGLWKETTYPGDNWIAITQEGQKTEMILIGFFKGQMETYRGTGQINGNNIYYDTHWTKNTRNIVDNKLYITLSEDGKTMERQ